MHAAAPPENKEAATHILQGRARRCPWHAPYTQHPAAQAPDNAAAPEGGKEAAHAAPGAGGAAHQGSISTGLATAPPWAPLGPGSPHPMPQEPSGDLAAPAYPAAMYVRHS